MGYIYSFITVKFYPIIELKVGNLAVFLFFGVSAFLGSIFLAIFLPETHGKSLHDIEEYFKGNFLLLQKYIYISSFTKFIIIMY